MIEEEQKTPDYYDWDYYDWDYEQWKDEQLILKLNKTGGKK